MSKPTLTAKKRPRDFRGWYVYAGNNQYLHKDGKIEHGCRNISDAFWSTKKEAESFIRSWQNKGWYQINSPDDLSVGESYFYCDIHDTKSVLLAEFHGDGFTCEQETLEFDDNFAYGDFWFKDFTWPSHPLLVIK